MTYAVVVGVLKGLAAARHHPMVHHRERVRCAPACWERACRDEGRLWPRLLRPDRIHVAAHFVSRGVAAFGEAFGRPQGCWRGRVGAPQVRKVRAEALEPQVEHQACF